MPGRNGDSKGLSDLAKDTQELVGSGLNSGLIDLRDPGMILRFADPESESSSPSGSGPHLPPYHSSLPASSALIRLQPFFLLWSGFSLSWGQETLLLGPLFGPPAHIPHLASVQGLRAPYLPPRESELLLKSARSLTNPWITRILLRLTHLPSELGHTKASMGDIYSAKRIKQQQKQQQESRNPFQPNWYFTQLDTFD